MRYSIETVVKNKITKHRIYNMMDLLLEHKEKIQQRIYQATYF